MIENGYRYTRQISTERLDLLVIKAKTSKRAKGI